MSPSVTPTSVGKCFYTKQADNFFNICTCRFSWNASLDDHCTSSCGTTAGSCNSSDSFHSTAGHCEATKQKRFNGESECSCKALN